MPLFRFPDLQGVPPENTPEGMVALGGDLSPENLMEAYRHGIFPWPVTLPDGTATGEGKVPLTWFSPAPRAILDFTKIHVPRSLQKARKRSTWRFSNDEDFEGVIRGCEKTPRPGQDGTWITPSMSKAYCELHRAGYAHSFEVWDDEELVGGIYGVEVDGAFGGESMFHRRPNASKLALLALIDYLQSRGLDWMDIQMLTPHLTALGAAEISRDDFLEKLAATRARGLTLF